MSERRIVSYPKAMRARAARDGKGLATIGYEMPGGGGWHSQGPATAREIAAVHGLLLRIVKGELRGNTKARRKKTR